MSILPPFPEGAPDGSARVRVAMRYEDVAQDGRYLVESLATSVNETLWRVALKDHALEVAAFERGLLAILSRFVIETGDGPFSVDGPVDAEARFVLAHERGADGAVQRLYLNAWVEAYAPVGRTNLPPPPSAGERACVGRAFAEHVFTRPFEAPSNRKVTRLDVPGVPELPPRRYEATPPEALLSPPGGGGPIDAVLSLDPAPIVFGLRHTDSNQHVNSLVYPRLFEEASIRRFAALGLETKVLARTLEIAYRKPCFAGEHARVALAAFRSGDALGAAGGFYGAAELERAGSIASAKPNATVRMTFTGV